LDAGWNIPTLLEYPSRDLEREPGEHFSVRIEAFCDATKSSLLETQLVAMDERWRAHHPDIYGNGEKGVYK
jgi:hypothetical protein